MPPVIKKLIISKCRNVQKIKDVCKIFFTEFSYIIILSRFYTILAKIMNFARSCFISQ